MKRPNTKQIILYHSLRLFSTKGYDAVTVADIAHAVGIRAPSLYNHFASKQEIFDSILAEMNRRYEDYSNHLRIRRLASEIREQSPQETATLLLRMGRGIFRFCLEDAYASKFWKLLTIDQFRSRELARMYVGRNIEAPLQAEQEVFDQLIAAGKMLPIDTRLLSLQFYSPIFLLLNLCLNNSKRKPEAIKEIKRHVNLFSQQYLVGFDMPAETAN